MDRVAEAQFYPTADNPVPPGGRAISIAVDSNVRIRAAEWSKGTRGTIFVLPGRTEAIEKYFETIKELLAQEFSVVILDWRGQGASSRALPDMLKGHVRDFSDYLADLSAVLQAFENGLPQPFLILAHSMGGNIALRALHDWPKRFAGAALSAPMIGLKQVPGTLAAILGHILSPQAYVPNGQRFDPYTERFESNLVTHDAKRFARNIGILKANPALALGSPTWGWLRAALASNRMILRAGYLETITAPVLILSAGAERIVDNNAHVAAAKALARVTQMVIAGARHEILQETDFVRSEFWRRFSSFAGGFGAS